MRLSIFAARSFGTKRCKSVCGASGHLAGHGLLKLPLEDDHSAVIKVGTELAHPVTSSPNERAIGYVSLGQLHFGRSKHSCFVLGVLHRHIEFDDAIVFVDIGDHGTDDGRGIGQHGSAKHGIDVLNVAGWVPIDEWRWSVKTHTHDAGHQGTGKSLFACALMTFGNAARPSRRPGRICRHFQAMSGSKTGSSAPNSTSWIVEILMLLASPEQPFWNRYWRGACWLRQTAQCAPQ